MIINSCSFFFSALSLTEFAYVQELPKERKYAEMILACISTAMALYSKCKQRNWIYISFLLHHVLMAWKVYYFVGNDVKNHQEHVINIMFYIPILSGNTAFFNTMSTFRDS